MAKEIERKYLIASDDWRSEALAGALYRQGYLSTDPQRSVRIRIAEAGAWLNIKSKISPLSRYEFEYPIPKVDAEIILNNLCLQPLIEKTRYRAVYAGFTWEIDVFAGDNAGLIVAELELESENQIFERPPWLGREISHDPRYLNINLVRRPFSRW